MVFFMDFFTSWVGWAGMSVGMGIGTDTWRVVAENANVLGELPWVVKTPLRTFHHRVKI
jgi:hypothetical protein